MNHTLLEISVGVMPDGSQSLSIQPELEIIKPALLYGDMTTLYSPHILMLQHLDKQGTFTPEELYDHIETYSESHQQRPEEQELKVFFDSIEQLRNKPHRTYQEDQRLQLASLFKADLKRQHDKEIRPKVAKQLDSVGYKYIRKAISQGLLTITPLVSDKTLLRPGYDDVLIRSYINHIEQVMQKPGAYPLLDTFSIDVVKALVEDGRLPHSVIGSAHGKQVGIATQLLRHAPTFPKANVYDIIDIRKELRKPLVRFRSATIRLGELIEAPIFGREFEAEVNDLVIKEIDPALLEIEEATDANKYLKQLRNEAIGRTGSLVSSGLTMVMAEGTDILSIVSTAATAFSGIALTAKAAQASVTAFNNKREVDQEIREREMFFLFDMEKKLKKRVSGKR